MWAQVLVKVFNSLLHIEEEERQKSPSYLSHVEEEERQAAHEVERQGFEQYVLFIIPSNCVLYPMLLDYHTIYGLNLTIHRRA